ncbi:methylated-DNA--[protein]-cysteine S-methyltransferase [Acholeplasma laidlawii]|uniref:methylated-DNA--[protein]-cysteine S-methyltransferase n=2 Tax=Acholeplasma laidlawii TaxID=2148 RepID=A9NH81_ACHLI|nr:methylated-DNA--[protein]-cysteine S-methyltransferase [Acholeplasma laidlawii]ABX81711.1 methylated-DNA-[protein]-cysteine S-methyltransferase [Acholeplasma laidlawii PG-8A]NWH09712.1 methylated-DNA--[protein]-cysteine S-methyltransferase [Acholeplasma laidlawii]NWH11102.1 methylated-DNA--[protein]-cysteine S-methyltransferase [Acholeplasma laidlawii]NWH13487.1 methylated-DNA--[protein]-cysteine S-methyltransferase [Acholeplasma laidlawii]NWH14534.1 methylated-DNA--[protein]-cysteine S-met
MLYYDFISYGDWTFTIKVSKNGLKSIDIYNHQDLSNLTLNKEITAPYIQILDNYFKGIPIPKDIKLDLEGSSFEKLVWQQLIEIPYGKTASYKDIAVRISNPRAYQAVGNAVGSNPLLIVIPCHRVIKSDGRLGGFSSDIQLKIDLLHKEGGKYL